MPVGCLVAGDGVGFRWLFVGPVKLITDLKNRQAVPVHILDKVSRSLPESLWLDTMSATRNQINMSGKARTYNAVSNLYSNLTDSGHFKNISLGRTFEVPEGVSFSLTCSYEEPAASGDEPTEG